MMTRRILPAIFILLFQLFVTAASYAAGEDSVAAAKKEGEVVLYLSTNLTDANGMIQLFKQKYPFINVNAFRADNEKLLNRILTESATGKFNGDVIMISSFEVRVLMQKKLLQKYVSPHSQFYPEGFTDKDGFWTSVYSIPRVIAYNTKLVRPDAAPKTFEDLLHPRWKGGIGLSDSAVLWYTGFLKFHGEEKGRDYMRKLATQKPAFRDSETVITQLLTAGEFPLGLTYSHQAATMKRRGAPVEWVRTAQPIVTGLKPIGLSAKAQHPNAGRLFIDVVLSKEGQELIKSFNRIPDRGDVTSELKEGTKLFPADPRWGDTYAKHVEEFREIFFKQ
jgi:iron(III) transport system substrate-binding protein